MANAQLAKPQLTEADIIEAARCVCEHGFGTVEVIVREGKIDTIHETRTHKADRRWAIDKSLKPS